jgi:TonB-linked SusC/RagA family outer membrane protein
MKKLFLAGILIMLSGLTAYSQESHQQNIGFSGIVIEEKTRTVLPGATVHIEGTTHEVLTDKKGAFSFLTGQRFPIIIKVSFVGFQTQQYTVTTGDPVTITLKESISQLNDVVVVGYGTQSRKNLIGSVSKVNVAETKNIVAGSFDAQLQGKVPGVQISSNTGIPGESVNVRVRGATSINADNDPLYVIDGVFINSNSLQTINSGGKATSPIADINPSDIESIEILKDAEATALYGSRGANGVVIVTTKRGNYNQRAKVVLNVLQGAAKAPELWDLTTGQQHAELTNEWWINTGKDNPSLNRTVANRPFRPVAQGGRGLPEEQQTYDRLDELFRTGRLQTYDLSLSGGTESTKYYISGNYSKQEAIIRPIYFERAGFKVNLDQKINDRVVIGTSNTITRTYRNQGRAGDGPQGGLLQAALHTPTNLSPYNEQGILVGRAGFDNLTLLIDNYDVNSASLRYIGNLYLEAELIPDLKFRSSFGVDYNNYDESEYWNTSLLLGAPPTTGAAGGYATSSVRQFTSWLNEQTLTYRKKFGNHKVGVLVGNTLQSDVLTRTYAEGRGFANNSFRKIISASAVSGSENWTKATLASFFGRADYSFKEKYLIDFSLRADASSRFGTENKWGYFPAVGAAWRIKEEAFLKDVSFIHDLKLRASYGITGNQNGIGDFAALGLWTGNAPYEGSPGTAPQQLSNPALKWEKTKQFNIGLDLALFDGRLTFDANYYDKYTTDGLLQLALAGTSGFSNYWSNAAEISNRGFELGINSTNIKNKNFSWTTSLNLGRNINNIEKLETPLPYGSRNLILQKQGNPLYSFWVYNQLYVDPQTGNAVYEDVNKDGKTTEADRQLIGSIWPKLFGGLTNTLSYKGFDANIFFSFQYGNKTYNHNRFFGEGGGSRDAARVILASNLARWQKPGDITDVPRTDGVNVNNYLDGGGRFLEDGSFIRLRALTIGYTFPGSALAAARIQAIRLYVTGSNLLLFTKYSGLDPESSASSDPNQQGIDLGTPPQPRAGQVGLTVTF